MEHNILDTPIYKEVFKETLRDRFVILPRFSQINWPEDPLLQILRGSTDEVSERFKQKTNTLFDPLDLKYQTLFRLTTFKYNELFSGNNPNMELISSTVNEQYTIIKERLKESDLPLDFLLGNMRFEKKGWHIKRNEGNLFVSNGKKFIKVEIRGVDCSYANAVFEDLHYIHTPRCDIGIGLFVDGEKYPISVLGITKIDREYKKVALLLNGYDPEYCWDIARLYNIPDSVKNVSSVMLSGAIRFLKREYPKTQAVLTAFTPSFATGFSMLSGGFENPILVKPLNLTFGNLGNGWERLTERRLSAYAGEILTNQLPLLPTVELMSVLRKPVFEPMIHKDEMIGYV